MEKLYRDALEEVMGGIQSSPRDQLINEKLNFTMKVNNVLECGFEYPMRKFNYKYLGAELCWYMNGNLETENIGRYAGLWNAISDEEGKARSNYGYLVFGKQIVHEDSQLGGSQFEWALRSLIKDKDSRQAIVKYNHEGVQKDGEKDFICTLNQQFFIRDNKLICINNMRSNDLFYGFSYDIVWFSLVMQSMFLSLKHKYPELELGEMYHNAGSAHIYEPMFNKANEIINFDGQGSNISIELTESLYNMYDSGESTEEKDFNMFETAVENKNIKEFIEGRFNIKFS